MCLLKIKIIAVDFNRLMRDKIRSLNITNIVNRLQVLYSFITVEFNITYFIYY